MNFILFLKIIAWVGAVWSTLIFVLASIAALSYTRLDAAVDRLRGVKRTYPVKSYLIAAIFFWAIIISLKR